VKVQFRIPRRLLEDIHADLSRPHPFAAERVGFLACRPAATADGMVLLAHEYRPVADTHYEEDYTVGAMMGSVAIRTALEYAYQHKMAMFHLHRHDHRGHPRFSMVDRREAARFVPDFWNVAPRTPHGALVLSHNRIHGHWWDQRTRLPQSIHEYMTVGFPTTLHLENDDAGLE
jgi:hypothetical protein